MNQIGCQALFSLNSKHLGTPPHHLPSKKTQYVRFYEKYFSSFW
jgi:hypothetical protein